MASTDRDKAEGNHIIEFVRKNLRYFIAGVLFIVILLVLVKFTGTGTGKDQNGVEATEEVVTEEAYQENAIPAVNELITNYFNAYAAGDITTLQTLATPITANEQSYIGVISQYIEGYQDINCYTKSGLDSNSYLVSVSLDVKFMDIETPAPGLYFFYVRTNGDGGLYIDNLYSEYNLSRQESALDTSIRNLITTFYNSTDVIELQNEIQQKYDAALSSDENLLNLCATTIPNAITEWRNTIVAAEPEDTEEVPNTEEVPTTEETPASFDSAAKTVMFQTKGFSNYAVAYKKSETTTENSTKESTTEGTTGNTSEATTSGTNKAITSGTTEAAISGTSEATKDAVTVSPKTGEDMNRPVFFILMLVSAMGCFYAIRKEKP